MIAFLTLLYIGVLALLLKFKVIKLTLWWKLSPVVWMLLLTIVLFIPMQWGAPSGPVTMFQKVVEVIPNVTGEVIEVSSKALAPMEDGDVIFKIDPRTFEYKVRQIEASRDVTKINLARAVKLAKQDFASQFDVDRLTAELKGLEAQLDEANYNLEQTIVRAPSKGFIIALTLQPGQRVANLPIRS
jgi:multidrug resistance efflux pump